MLRRFGQVQSGLLGFLCGGGHSRGGFVNARDQHPKLVDGVVDRVSDRPGEILCYCRGGGQVTIREVGQFVEQPQNRVLVALVGFCGDFQTAVGGLVQLQAYGDQHD